MIDAIAGLVLVAVLWGCTNPFVKLASNDIKTIEEKSKVLKFFKEFYYLIKNWRYMLPFLLNQVGSVAYMFVLQSSDLSFVVPIVNSLTFVFTALTGWIIGEDKPSRDTMLGMILVLMGTTICWIDKTHMLRSETDPKSEL